MGSIRETIQINAPPAAVWALLGDFANVAKWNPNLSGSRLLTKAETGVGAERHCDFVSSGFVRERVVGWQEGASYVVEVAATDEPIKSGTMGFAVRADGAVSEATFHMDYTLKFGIIGKILDAVMVRKQMNGVARKILRGLKTHAEAP